MGFNLSQWIEEVREKPEPVRKRYVIVSVMLSMGVVFGLWLLTVSENFKQVADDATQGAEVGRDILRPSQETLDQFLNSKSPLSDDEQTTTGQEFIEKEFENRTRPGIGDEGLVPKSKPDDSATNR